MPDAKNLGALCDLIEDRKSFQTLKRSIHLLEEDEMTFQPTVLKFEENREFM
jgi:hypothetical protein